MTAANPYLIDGPALISFSGGRSSRYMLKTILDAYSGTLPDNIKVAFANTGKEFPETLDFVQDVSSHYGVHIAWLEYDRDAEHHTKIVSHNSASRKGEPFKAVIKARQMLPNPVIGFCTIELKIRRFREYAVHLWPMPA
jgi:3'-phosphoadenosine 5'-phosphosulfate sulfotransferase (PAPS reductase)/FAD synthetase